MGLFDIATASSKSDAERGVKRVLGKGGLLENRRSQALAARRRDFLFDSHRRRQLLGP